VLEVRLADGLRHAQNLHTPCRHRPQEKDNGSLRWKGSPQALAANDKLSQVKPYASVNIQILSRGLQFLFEAPDQC
jgi:hypothetical protein